MFPPMNLTKQYAVKVDVSGSVTCIVKADTNEEAKEMALAKVHGNLTGLHNKTYNAHTPKQSYVNHQSFDDIVGSSPCDMDFDKYYDIVLNYLGGPKALEHCLPATIKEIKERCGKDKNLNEIPLKEWDRATGYDFSHCINKPVRFYTNLQGVLREHGVSYYTCSQCVCLLKHAARKLIESE